MQQRILGEEQKKLGASPAPKFLPSRSCSEDIQRKRILRTGDQTYIDPFPHHGLLSSATAVQTLGEVRGFGAEPYTLLMLRLVRSTTGSTSVVSVLPDLANPRIPMIPVGTKSMY